MAHSLADIMLPEFDRELAQYARTAVTGHQ